MPKRRVTRKRTYKRDKNGRFATGGVKRWSAKEKAEPFKKSRSQVAAEKHIAGIKAKVGFVDSEKPVPTGKTVLLLHRTTNEAANSIVRQGFRVNQHNTPYTNALEGQHVYGVLPSAVNNWRGYGEAIVGVKVSRKLVKTDESMSTYYPAPIKVHIKDLQGRKVKRYITSGKTPPLARGDWAPKRPKRVKNSSILRYLT